MSHTEYEALKLGNQLCFPLYAAARAVMQKYRPFLSEIDLTYTQYITMMVLWEEEAVSAKELGRRLCLDSGTLTPVLKSLEGKGLVTRERAQEDERVLQVTLTPAGKALKKKAVHVPEQIVQCMPLSPEEGLQLYGLLYKILQAGDTCNKSE